MNSLSITVKTLHRLPSPFFDNKESFFFYFNGMTTLEKTEELTTHVPFFDKNYFSKYKIEEISTGIILHTKERLSKKEIYYVFVLGDADDYRWQ